MAFIVLGGKSGTITDRESVVKQIIRAVIVAALVAAAVSSAFCYAANTKPTITIHAKRYAFIPAEITLKKDETVTLLLISDDVPHGLAVSGLGIRSDMLKGTPTAVTLTPTKTGDFGGVCSRFCGMGHGSMKFTVHVVP